MATRPENGSRADHAAIRRLADELLPALMSRLEASDLGELEVRQDGWRVRLRKPVGESSRPSERGAGRSASPVKAGSRESSSRPMRADAVVEPVESPRRVVVSPAVGVFQPPSGSTLGRQVSAGDVVGRVEVLGVPQEVVAPFDGVLGRMLVEPGTIVEYGEPLMRIDPATRSAAEPGSSAEPRRSAAPGRSGGPGTSAPEPA